MQQAEMPRRKWAFPLSVVAPVMIDIDQVIQQVGARRRQTKRDSGEHRVRHALLASVLMGSQQRNEDQKILDPLMGAQCLEHRQRMPQAIGADDLTRIV